MSHLPKGFSARRLSWHRGSTPHGMQFYWFLSDSHYPKATAWILSSTSLTIDGHPLRKLYYVAPEQPPRPLATAKREAERLYVAKLQERLLAVARGEDWPAWSGR